MKKLLLIIATIVSLGCSSLSNKGFPKQDKYPLPREVKEWFKDPNYYLLGYHGEFEFTSYGIEGFRNQYDRLHSFYTYDLNGDGKEDLNVLFRIEKGGDLKYPTMMVYDENKDGKTDIRWVDFDNNGVIDFEKRGEN